MNRETIKKYALNISKNDILNFAKNEKINISNSELETIYSAIKNETDEILNLNFYNYIKKYKDKLNLPLYNKIIEKYEKYKFFIN